MRCQTILLKALHLSFFKRIMKLSLSDVAITSDGAEPAAGGHKLLSVWGLQIVYHAMTLLRC